MKVLKEELDDQKITSAIYDALGNIYNDDFYELIKDIVERAWYYVEEDTTEDDLWDIVYRAMDDGMMYTENQWTMLKEYCEPQNVDFDDAWSSMESDVFEIIQILRDSKDKDIDESFEEEQKKAEKRAKRETIKRMVAEREKGSLGDRIEASKLKKELDESIAVEIDESCKSKKKSKKLNETWAGEDVLDDLKDRAKLIYDDSDGQDIDEVVWDTIDQGLIYNKDIIDLAEHYGVIDTSELIERFYDDLSTDIRDALQEYANEKEEDEEDMDEKLEESLHVEIDEDEALDMLMSRLTRWTQDPIAEELYEQMYQSYIDDGVFDGGEFDVMVIVDNDWVNYCEVVEPGDEELHYDELLKLYEEQGLGDVSTEDVGFSYIEAAVERNGKVYFLCRW